MAGPASPLIHDLALVVLAASGVVALATRLRIPALPCHLVAGILIGVLNRRADSPILSDVNAVASLSNLGVSFLMFSIGLEFDFGKARALLAPAVLAMFFQGVTMFAVGGLAAAAMGAGQTTAIFLGALLGISSTLVSVSSLTELGHMSRNYGRLTVGILILEDIVAILLLTILSGLGVHHSAKEHPNVVGMVFLIGAFVVLVLTAGRLVLRRALESLRIDRSPESLAVVVGALVLGVGLLSERFEYSPALGAFVIGAALAHAGFTHKIEETAQPFRHLFSAVFFVTLGTSIRPESIWEAMPVVIPLTFAVLVIKSSMCWLGAFLGGQRPASAVRMALNMAQIGEFSFVLAALGERAGVIGPEVTAITAGVSLLTIVAHRPLVSRSDAIIAYFEKRTPAPLRQAADFYGNLIAGVSGRLDKATVWKVLHRPLTKTAMHLTFIGSAFGGAHLVCAYILPGVDGAHDPRTSAHPLAATAVWAAAVIIGLPFVIALGRNIEAMVLILSEATFGGVTPARHERAIGVIHRLIRFAAAALTALMFILFATPWLPAGYTPLILLVVVGVPAWLFRNALSRVQSRFEILFLESFNRAARHEESAHRATLLHGMVKKHKWPLHLREAVIEAGTRAAGAKLSTVSLREKTGAFVTSVQRGELTVFDPAPDTPLFPGDELMLLGTREQLDKAVALFKEPASDNATPDAGFLMEQAFVAHDSVLAGETLAGARIRHTYGVTVAGVQRGEQQHLSPGPDFVLKSGDILLVAGRVEAVTAFRAIAAGGLREE